MPTMGELLRDARHRLGVSLEQAEYDTKIRKKYLEAMEDDDYPSLPAPVYSRGFLQIYAEYLGVDPSFAEKLFQPPARVAGNPPSIRPAASGLRDSFSVSWGVVLVVLMLFMGGGAIFYLYGQYSAFATAPAEVVYRPTPLPTSTAVPTRVGAPVVLATATPSPSPSPSATPVRAVEVVVSVLERTWIRVIADGQNTPMFEGELQSGETRVWKARDRIDMRVGNAGGVDVTVNGMRQGKLGASGEVKNVTWGRQ